MTQKEITDKFFALCYHSDNLVYFKNYYTENKKILNEFNVIEKGLSWVVSAITEYSNEEQEDKKVKFKILVNDIKSFEHLSYFSSKLFFENKEDYFYIKCLLNNEDFKKEFISYLESDLRLVILLKNRNDVEEKLDFLSKNKIYIKIKLEDVPEDLKEYFEKYLLQLKIKEF